MTAELVAKLGVVEVRGERPCVPPAVLIALLQALHRPPRTFWSKLKAWTRWL